MFFPECATLWVLSVSLVLVVVYCTVSGLGYHRNYADRKPWKYLHNVPPSHSWKSRLRNSHDLHSDNVIWIHMHPLKISTWETQFPLWWGTGWQSAMIKRSQLLYCTSPHACGLHSFTYLKDSLCTLKSTNLSTKQWITIPHLGTIIWIFIIG